MNESSGQLGPSDSSQAQYPGAKTAPRRVPLPYMHSRPPTDAAVVTGVPDPARSDALPLASGANSDPLIPELIPVRLDPRLAPGVYVDETAEGSSSSLERDTSYTSSATPVPDIAPQQGSVTAQGGVGSGHRWLKWNTLDSGWCIFTDGGPSCLIAAEGRFRVCIQTGDCNETG